MSLGDNLIVAREASPLRMALEKSGLPLKDVTVLASQNDPYRLDTPSNHRDGAWLAMQVERLGLQDRTVHLRGLHYALIGSTRPNGQPYVNDDPTWLWLSGTVAKAARWLGYLPWDQVVDQRNAAPTVRIHQPPDPRGLVTVGELGIYVPDVDELEPTIEAKDFRGVQPFKIVLFGEKSSLEPVLAPVAKNYKADLYLPTGEISDTLLYRMASVGAQDGRPMVVLTFSDCDPSGWQMPISIGRKLMAFKTILFPELEFSVWRVGLLPEHVRAHGLPSTPLKATEKRADAWQQEMHVQQTEIDALAALQPGLLRKIASKAVGRFYDTQLDVDVMHAHQAWHEEAQQRLDEALTPAMREEFRAAAVDKLSDLQEQVDALEAELRIDPGDIDLPEIVLPESTLQPPDEPPLIDSTWTFIEQCERLIASKQYRDGDR